MKRAWTLQDLEILSHVARRSSFRAAAMEFGVTPAYVTRRIAALEAALGVVLFHRTTRRVKLSTAGQEAYEWARRVLDDASNLESNVTQAPESLRGTLRISTSMRLGRKHIAPILCLFAQEHPQLNFWLELVDRRVDLIAEGFDIDIRVGEVEEPHLVVHKICDSERILCAAPAYLERHGQPQTLSELPNHECLMYRDRGQPFTTLRMQGPHGAESVNVSARMESNHSDPITQWVMQGQGIALLASWDIADILRDGTVVRVLPSYQQAANIHAAMTARTKSSAKLRMAVVFLTRHLLTGPFALDLTAESWSRQPPGRHNLLPQASRRRAAPPGSFPVEVRRKHGRR